MFVNPVRKDAEVPELFTKYGATVDKPETWPPRRSPRTVSSGSSRGPRSY